ncbi:plasminogen-like isoform X2 [Thamnophis elegans]|uniref:plasminogen-like isoform X2 n=1 Tax=Thamnophis elegans TaxID=35005 RepID=UPI0013769B14|nr:plasminogen-like isoform X2 [Thamnophis elegans]
MECCKYIFGLVFFLYTVQGNILDNYVRTDGAWILGQEPTIYRTLTKGACAIKCETETAFTCRAFLFTAKEQQCIMLNDNTKTAPVFRKAGAILFEKRIYLLECRIGIGVDYRGMESKTRNGVVCQKWTDNSPHNPNYTPSLYPNASLEENYCRNPDHDGNGPWCYTTNPETRYDSCNIPECEEQCMHCSGENYRGKVSTTESGLTCQAWASQEPHTHGYIPSKFPEKNLISNYCRNPDGEQRPWCFTSLLTKRWEFCSIPRCATSPPAITGQQCLVGNGEDYRGNVGVTESGKTCQSWASQEPHTHGRTPENYPCKGLEENYCRNPNGETKPWCYTSDPNTRWQYCNIAKCDDVITVTAAVPVVPPQISPQVPQQEPQQVPQQGDDCYNDNGSSYRGTTAVTITGKKCQAWISMRPHRHSKTPSAFPDAGLTRNYCRNPDGGKAPWCYTTDPETRWEYCNLQKCAKPKPSYTLTLDIDCRVGSGRDYRGHIETTVSGKPCQEWQSHGQTSFTPETHPTSGLEKNYCRNPDGDTNGPWCYTTDEKTVWEYCDVPQCPVPDDGCGRAKYPPRLCFGRIVGSCVSNPHSWPWQMSLRIDVDKRHYCGGTLIQPQWVLTATHCLNRSPDPNYYTVSLGLHTKAALEPSAQHRSVEKIFKEPYRADIALLKLSSPVRITNEVIPVCLPSANVVVAGGTECYVTGWGDTKGTGGEGLLKETGFPVIENKVCNRPEFLDNGVDNHELCAGNIDGASDSCEGDSGGPLVCEEQGRYVLHGVTSWGEGCAQPMKPGVYVRVSHFMPWILSILRENDYLPNATRK